MTESDRLRDELVAMMRDQIGRPWELPPRKPADPTAPKSVEVDVDFHFTDSDPPMPLAEFIRRLSETLDHIPEPYRSVATVEIVGEFGMIDITYRRPETSQEINERLAREAETLLQQESYERETYARLKAKFGS